MQPAPAHLAEYDRSEDLPLLRAIRQIERRGPAPGIAAFFDPASSTVSYLVSDPDTRRAAIIDSVLDYDVASITTATASADGIARHAEAAGLEIDWHLETHIHADHLTAADHLKHRLGGRIGAGSGVVPVQRDFAAIFGLEGASAPRETDFDRLFADGEEFAIGNLPALVLHVPGHTPADVAYLIGDRLFVGDTLFMPDYGTARADFPRGDARQLYRSIRRLLSLPGATRLHLCHDYKAPGRDDYRWECTIAEQRAANIHVRDGMSEDDFVTLRETRDTTLALPALFYPSIQVNIRGGKLPEREPDGRRFLKLPLNAAGARRSWREP